MTPKEAEHFLIENNWTYKNDVFPFWSYRGRDWPSITDENVQEDPDGAVKFIKQCLDISGLMEGEDDAA